MAVRIIPASLRDLTYIAANLRIEDVREASAQFDDWTPHGLAVKCLMAGEAWAVEVDGNPEAAFGVSPVVHSRMAVAWSWGTKRMWRAAPAITGFVRDQLVPGLIAAGLERCEARAMAQHKQAHRWLRKMGAVYDGPLECFGRNGEDFYLFSWTRRSLNVLQSPILPDAEAAGLNGFAGSADDRQ